MSSVYLNLGYHGFIFQITRVEKFRLTASVIASHFKHRCDRLFRYNTVAARLRETSGIGWRVPRKARQHTRPGVNRLMSGGDLFEATEIQNLIDEHGSGKVICAGIDKATNKVGSLPFDDFLAAISVNPTPKFLAQVELDFETPGLFEVEIEESFLLEFGLDPKIIQLTKALPDLIEIIEPVIKGEPYLLRIWDFKASRKPRHEHFIQVAFYTLLLEKILLVKGITNFQVDTNIGVVKARFKNEEFDLAPYRAAVTNFLRDKVPSILHTQAAQAHFHVCEGCMLCEYAETCRAEAEAGSDLSRVPYMSSVSKRRLKKAGFPTHRELAALHADPTRISELKLDSHDLSSNLDRYILASQSLEDGSIRVMNTKCLLMPQYEDVRVVISAEQDAVTATCFALGLKTYEGWDVVANKPAGLEEVFISTAPEHEGAMLLSFLSQFNGLLSKIDHENRAAEKVVLPADLEVEAAKEVLTKANDALAAFKALHPRLLKARANYELLIEERNKLEAVVKEAEQSIRDAKYAASTERRRLKKRLHIYVYDGLDLIALKECLERHLLSNDPAGLLDEVKQLVRLFPPECILPDADTFRSIPGTVLSQVIRQSLVLPIPYGFDLASVSSALKPVSGEYSYKPKYGFGWHYSNQIAFERIHDVWEGNYFKPDPHNSARDLSPDQVKDGIDLAVRSKLRATDSVVRALKGKLNSNLLLQKEPFQLYGDFNPTASITEGNADRVLDVMQVFTVLEESFAELSIKHQHTLPAQERVAKFECIRGLKYVDRDSGVLEFTFDPECKDAKFEIGDFNLVLTLESQPDNLLIEVDGPLFRPAGWRGSDRKVTLERVDVHSSPPKLWLRPANARSFDRKFEESGIYVLDKLYVDYNSPRVLSTIAALRQEAESEHIHKLISRGTIEGWSPFITNKAKGETELVRLAGKTREELMNAAQWCAVSGVMQVPLGLIWGPPGTGKTYTVAHMLLCYAINAHEQGTQLRILVSAFTHHAIANVLRKTIELADKYGLSSDIISVFKVAAGGTNTADEEVPGTSLIGDQDIVGQLTSASSCVVIGATVWAVHKAMKDRGIPQQWFDVVLVDEASQMKLSDALIAMAASKPSASLLLAGDDKQLPPILHGKYAEEHKPVLSSVFSFMRYRMEQTDSDEGTQLINNSLFQLEENFRMNEPLTTYPRKVIYKTYSSTVPNIKISLAPLPVGEPENLFADFLLDPDRPVFLVRYTPSKSYTAKNPVESHLVAQLVSRLSKQLMHEDGSMYSGDDFMKEGVGVLAPHRAQNSAIRYALSQLGFGQAGQPMPLVDTVEKLQGKEREVVLVSYGVADEEYAEIEATFLLSQNRFNVASTRAKRKLIVFCADPVINVVPVDRQTLLDATMLKEFKNFCSDGEKEFKVDVVDVGEVVFTVHWKEFTK